MNTQSHHQHQDKSREPVKPLANAKYFCQLMNQALTPLMKQAEAVLKGMAGNLSKVTALKVSVVVCDGKPFEAICRMAQKLSADLITLTTHGYTGLKRVWLGSTAERTVRHASCPVLVVRELGRRKF